MKLFVSACIYYSFVCILYSFALALAAWSGALDNKHLHYDLHRGEEGKNRTINNLQNIHY